MDIVEDERALVIKAELPDVKKQDVTVTIGEGVITIAGERSAGDGGKVISIFRSERSGGVFLRSFALPEGIETGRMLAQFNCGVLVIHLPKTRKTKPEGVEARVE